MQYRSLIILLVLASSALAQDAIITLVTEKTSVQNANTYLGQQYPPYTLSFGGTVFVKQINASVSSYATQSSYQLCVYFDQNSADQTCSPIALYTSQEQTLELPITPRYAASATFTTRGFTSYSWYDQMYLNRITWTGGPAKTITQSIFALRDTKPKKLGIVKDFLPSSTSPALVSSSDARASAWLNNPASPSPTGRTTTQNYNDEVLACLNSDRNADAQGNPKCDYIDEQECAAKGKDWFDGHCCGDTPYTNCQWYEDKKAICGKDAQGRFKWAALADIGMISILDGCPKIQLVSDGQKLYTCSDVPTGFTNVAKFQGKITISGHDYTCQGEQLIECGGESPYSPNAKRTGEKLNLSGKFNYCTSGGKWTPTLDGTDRKSCISAGLTWTGTKCCGETDDPTQSYEDPYNPSGDGTAGGCFKGRFIGSGSPLAGNRNVINHRGAFNVCDPDKPQAYSAKGSAAMFEGTGLTPTLNGPCGTPLQGALLTGTRQNILCMPSGSWETTASTLLHHVKSTGWPAMLGQQKKGCCPENQCWDGAKCRMIGEYFVVNERGYRCQ